MGYRSDFQGTIRAVFAGADAAANALDELRRLCVTDRNGFAPYFDYARDDRVITASVDRYEMWLDAESDIGELVTWLRGHRATHVSGDVRVCGEEPYDLWRIHVCADRVMAQKGRVVYEEESS